MNSVKNHHLKSFVVAFGVLWCSLFLLTCRKSVDLADKWSRVRIYDAYTNNEVADSLVSYGDSVFFKVVYNIKPAAKPWYYWTIHATGKDLKDTLYASYQMTPMHYDTTPSASRNVWDTVEWRLKFPDEPLLNKNSTYKIAASIKMYHISTQQGWPGQGDPTYFRPILKFPEGFHGCDVDHIYRYCGDHRYLRIDETLDYPLAYPLVIIAENVDSNPLAGELVQFKLDPGYTHKADLYPGGGNSTDTIITGNVDVGKLNSCKGTDFICGAKATLVPKDTGLIKVTAYAYEDGNTVVSTKFTLRCLEEENDGLTNDSYSFLHEEYDWDVISGDGLWGYWTGTPEEQVAIDLDPETKNLRLEIDYIPFLGPQGHVGCMKLRYEDVVYIYNLVDTLLQQTGIKLDPLVDVRKDVGEPANPLWTSGSIIQQMDDIQSYWSGDRENLIVGNCGYAQKYDRKTCADIQALTRSDTNYYGHYARRRLHIVLLPGSFQRDPSIDELSFDPYGISINQEGPQWPSSTYRGPSAHFASGQDYVFPWAYYDSESYFDKMIDKNGICIFTGRFPPIDPSEDTCHLGDESMKDSVSWNWKFVKKDSDGIDYNLYCYMLAAVIAHEICHSIGLEHEDNPKQLMYGEIDFKKHQVPGDEEGYRTHTQITSLHADNEKWDYFINLRKVVGREVTTRHW